MAVPERARQRRRALIEALSELPWGLGSKLDAAEIAKKPITIIGDDPRVDVLTVAWTVTFARA